MNGAAGAAEVAVQQCCLNVYGLPAHDCSDHFSFVFGAPAVQHERGLAALARGEEDADEAIEADVANGLAPPRG